MKASIVIDNYNYGRFLREAIDSALGQDYHDCEVIVVDDGSTDDSARIIASYGKRIVPILKANGGQASAFNAGFHASRGDVVFFLDADDMLAPTAVSAAMAHFQDPATVKVHWALWIIDERGGKTGRLFPPKEMPAGDFRQEAISNGPFYDSNFLPPTSGNAWSRRFLEQVMPIPEGEYDHGADVYLHTLAPIFGAMRSVEGPRGFYRAHQKNHYWKNALTDEKIGEYMARFESSCVALRKFLAAQGAETDEAVWKRQSFNYLWLQRLREARKDLQSLVPLGETLILVDDHDWGEGEVVPGRRTVSLLESDDEYLGHPTSDAAAIERLEELRRAGAAFIAFWWTAFWWFEKYSEFHQYLLARFPCLSKNDRLVIFGLRSSN